MVAKSDKKRLTDKQLKAIDLLVAGLTDTEVAERLGVARQTVNEWKNRNPAFIAELNRRRKAVYEASLSKLVNLTHKAIEIVKKEIEAGNWKLALEVLKMAGLDYRNSRITFGEIDEDEIEADMRAKKAFAEHSREIHKHSPIEHTVIRSDGSRRPVEILAQKVHIRGKPVLQGIFRDISKRRQMEEDLRCNEEKLRRMFESIADGITITDLNGIIIDVNEKAMEINGCRLRRNMIGKSALEFIAPHDRERARANMEKTLKEGSLKNVKYALLRSDGSEFRGALSASVLKDASGEPTGFIAVIRDITDQEKAEEKLLISENKYRTLLENLPQKIFLKDTGSVYISCNENYARDLKIRPEEITGKTDYDFYPQELAEKYREDDRKVVKSGKIIEVEEKYIRNGQERWVHTVKSPVKDDKGKVRAVLGIFWDITEQKQAIAEKEKLHAQLIQSDKMAAVGQLAGGVAHELNSPLTAILGNTQLLLTETDPSHQWYNELKEIEESVKRCQEITSNLLDFSRQEGYRFRKTDVHSIIEKTLALCERNILAENIEILRVYTHDLPSVMGSPRHLQQVFLNLILNAKDAMPEGGKLTITTSRRSQVIKETEAGREEGWIEISIADSGRGIKKDHLSRVFEPFFTTKEKGTGMGLSVSYRIIQNHNGEIVAESEGEGRGARFRVILPAHKNFVQPA